MSNRAVWDKGMETKEGETGCLCMGGIDDSDGCFHPGNNFPGGPRVLKRAKIREENEYEGLIRREFGHHEKGVARINNGSFGCCPSSVLSAQAKWARLFLQQPDSFFFGSLRKGLTQSRQMISEMVNAAHVEEISLVDNVTTAVAIVMQQVAWGFMEGKFEKGDAVLMLHYAYGAVKKAIQAYAVRAGARVIEVHLPFPVSSKEEIIGKFRKALEQGKTQSGRIRLAVLDHVTSMPSVVLPIKELIRICREEGVDQVFVDGAHAIGNLDIDMQDISADFYTSNLHKWFFCPPTVAFLYCRRSLLPNLHHPVVSSEYGNGLAIESAWIGNRDYSPQLSVPAALEFVKQFEGGIEGIRKKNHDSVVLRGEMLAKAWDTHLGAPPELCSAMAMVGLPDSLKVGSEKDAMDLRTRLRKEFGVEVPIYHRPPIAKTDFGLTDSPKSAFSAYARISHQIYNTVDDYQKFRDAINQLVLEASPPQ
uniref:Aminotransferase class V domain-containing protein n=1 Tax=Picea sitchensis TaxID=3332 RepID=B8LR57_PICSI|nr:unknown [Picea sitchensis]